MSRVATVEAVEDKWVLPSRAHVGVVCLIIAESSVFVIFVVAYLFYLGKSSHGPTPDKALSPPIVTSLCLFSSSATIALAVRALRREQVRRFAIFWGATVALGLTFLIGTGIEWARLITQVGLTPATNLFGTTFYSLVGLHAAHVTAGLILLSLVLVLTLSGRVQARFAEPIDALSLYWHFVDCVWAVVLLVVYVIGR